MQDNYPQEYDEQFIGQAWSNMKELLDQEMPVKRRKPVAWWLWLSAGLVLLLSLSGAGYYLFQAGKASATPAATPPNTELSSPVAKQLQESPPQNQPQEASQIGSKGEALTVQKKKKATTSNPNIKKHLSSAITEGTFISPLQATSEVSASALAITKNIQDDVLPSTPESVNNPSTSAFELAKWDLPVIPSLEASIVASKSAVQGDVMKSIQRPQIKKQVQVLFSAEGRTAFLLQNNGYGLGVGLGMEARPENSRLYGRFGLFAQSYQVDIVAEEKAFLLENSFVKIPQPGGGLENERNRLSSRSSIQELQYIQLPLTVGFQVMPQLSVETGVQAGLLISSRTANSWSLNNDPNALTGPGTSDQQLYEFNHNGPTLQLNNTSLDFLAGLAFQPGQRTNFRLYYQHGFSRLTGDSLNKVHLQGVQFSFAYYLAH